MTPIAVAKLDRLSRDVHFITGLMAHECRSWSRSLAPDVEPFLLHLYAALAEKERAMISERTKAALAAAKARGQSSAILGWPRLAPSPMRARRPRPTRTPTPSCRQSAKPRPRARSRSPDRGRLNGRGIATARGGKWEAATVANILKRVATPCVSMAPINGRTSRALTNKSFKRRERRSESPEKQGLPGRQLAQPS